MRALLLIVLATASNDLSSGPSVTSGDALDPYHPDFEFTPTSGTGVGAACACAAVTGISAQVTPVAQTIARASSGTCLKGSTRTGIAVGDMVTCSANLPRMMYGNPTLAALDGVVGQLYEGARTNLELRSQEIDDPAWVKEQDAAPRTPTVTPNAANAPDGTLTADRFQAPATSGAQFSDFYQSVSAGAVGNAFSCTAFIEGNASSGTSDLCAYNGAAWTCADCAFVSASYTRCSVSVAGAGSTTRYCKFGNNSNQNGAIARNAIDVFVWGLDGEEGAFPSSYIATAGVAVARAFDNVSFTLPVATSATTASFAVTFIPEWSTGSSGAVPYLLYYDASGRPLYSNTDGTIRIFDGTNELTNNTTYTAGVSVRLWSNYTGALEQVNDGTDTASGPFDGAFGAGALTTLHVGSDGVAGESAFGVLKQLMVDNSASRCR